jgi:hypothetical protein
MASKDTDFIRQWIFVAVACMVFVASVAFVSIPYTIGPEARAGTPPAGRHLT